jgi:S-adenosylmethionine:tRNA ribosyltransferase-isomerase
MAWEMQYKVADFDFALPPELIAQSPARPRDSARLLVLDRKTGDIAHRVFRDLPQYLRPRDILVLNETRVLPARLAARGPSGGRVEVLLLRPRSDAVWEALIKPGRRVRRGARLVFSPGVLEGTAGGRTSAKTRLIALRYAGELPAVLERIGEMPVPPYIERPLDDPKDYQTVYARIDGAIAAPTAGLHFTMPLLNRIERAGIRIARLILHVGLGTFRPVRVAEMARHRMDPEFYEVGPGLAAAVNDARAEGGRIVAVGTTTVRALESAAGEDGTVYAGRGHTDLFITPGYTFRATDALITNFHLPRSTLLMLVSAFAGRERILAAYAEAVRGRYRFYSFGDAMLIV